MIKKLFHIHLVVALSLFAGCGKNGFLKKGGFDRLMELLLFHQNAGQGETLNGREDSSDGNDALSSSTNHSSKEEILQPKLDPLAGAAFIRSPQINNYGTVTLSYQMETLPGRAGMQPAVGLSYTSSGGDGLAGIGWSLSTGFGVIARSTGYGELYYDYRDTFTFNGKRLVKVSGPQESENGTYRLEIESGFSRLELSGAENGGVWKVYDTSGTVTVYGETADSRVHRPDDADQTYIWNFSSSTDLNGNCMTAAYDSSRYRDSNILYLKEIRYTGNSKTGAAALQYVRFAYKSRDDAYVSKAPGFMMKMDRLLDVVEIGWDDPGGLLSNTLWKYRLVYEVSEDSRRPVLITVRSTRSSTEPRFVYQKADHFLVWQNVDNPRAGDPGDNPDNIQYFEGDFNGDGLSDMVFFNPDTGEWTAAEAVPGGGYLNKTYGNRFRGYKGAGRIQSFKGGVTGDYNGDGRSDIAFYLPETKEFWIAQHNGRVFDFRNYGRLAISIDLFRCEWFSGDFDGNGLSDAVLFDEAAGQWLFMRNRGGYFDFLTLSRQFKNLFRSDYRPDGSNNSAATADASPFGRDRDRVEFFSGDYNGDGRTDISMYDARSGRWLVGENCRINNAPGFQLRWILYREFRAPEQALFAHDRFSGDYNGDGTSDFLVFDRACGEWWIGETGDRTIDFRVFSRAPQFRDVNRWLQGDFNGDGRTDIGFYSKTDNNIWIGESRPEGFRYRVYTNLAACPDSGRILDAPLPQDEVNIMDNRMVIANAIGTTPVLCQYDGNFHRDRGEQVLAGYFTGGTLPELLIYRRADRALFLKQGTGEPVSVISNIDLSADGTKVLGEGRAVHYRSNDGIAWYSVEGGFFGGRQHVFSIVHGTGTGIARETMASFSDGSGDGDIVNFDVTAGRYWIDRFTGTGNSHVMVLDDQAEIPAFVLYDGARASRLAISGGSLTEDYFRDLRLRKNVIVMSGLFASSRQAQLLLVDCSGAVHRWYLGTINGSAITFTLLAGNPQFFADGFLGFRVLPGIGSSRLICATMPADRVCFHLLTVQSGSVAAVRDYTLEAGATFRGDYDNAGNPVVYADASARRVVMNTSGCQLETIGPEYRMERPDLLTRVYPFRWLQGDYNGDGKTDIGFFHLKERQWYFALTRGTIPDLLARVDNGIGGSYSFEYANSSSFDNTDDEGVPRLPMNYRVCSSLLISDGLGRSVETRYNYARGYAYSGFVNGCKETDYFGFGEFTVVDAYGNRNMSIYHNVPYDDFRMNRALAGAIKESRHFGNDGIEYDRTVYSYVVHRIAESGSQSPSFLVVPSKVEKFARGIPVQTRESAVELVDGRYEMKSKTDTVTGHYRDGAHRDESLVTRSDFENNAGTNEMRLVKKVSLAATSHETMACYEYDSRGNMTMSRLSYTGSGLAAAADRVREYEYDNYGNRTVESDRSGTPSRIVEKNYDAVLHQFVVEERAVGDMVALKTGCEINYGSAFGSISRKTDPNGNSVYFDYDAHGRLSRERADMESGVVTLTEYDYSVEFPISGKAVQHTGQGGDAQTRVYSDGMGRAIHTVRSAMTEPGMRYVKSGCVIYDRAGRVIRASQPSFTGDYEIDRFNGSFTEKNPAVTEYDPSGRVARVTYPRGYDGEPETSVTYTYNDPWEVVEYHSAARSKRTVKNSRGLVLYVEDSGTGDDGVAVNAKIGFAYDIAGNRVKKMDLATSGLNPSLIDVPAGLFTPGVKDTSGANIACWRYNAFGQVTEMSDPDLGYVRFEYNAFGDATGRTDALGRTTTYVYDRLGRMIAKYLPGTEGVVTYAYDSKSGSNNALGRVAYIDDPTETKQFSYDKLGRVKEEMRVVKTNPPTGGGARSLYITRFACDLAGRKTAIQYPADPVTGMGVTVEYQHCPMGVTAVVVDNGASSKEIVRSISYNEFGQMTEAHRGNGSISYYAYDRKMRLSHLKTTAEHNGKTWTVQDVKYAFKNDDSIMEMVNTPDVAAGGAVQSSIKYSYQYDGLNRLIKADGSYEKVKTMVSPGGGDMVNPVEEGMVKKFSRGYRYAASGNMTGKTIYDPDSGSIDDDWRYIYNNHAVTGITSTAAGARYQMVYDDAGNMTAQYDHGKHVTKQMIYDSENRIREVRDAANQVIGTYEYDDQGFRVRKVAKRTLDGTDTFIETLSPSMYVTYEKEKGADGSVISGTKKTVNHIYLNGVRIAAVTPGITAVYYLTDQVDSVNVVLNDSGVMLSQTEFLPFGETWTQEGDKGHAPKYNSQELDKETGYYFYNARHYDPEICRFVTADNLIDGEYNTQGWNRFAYVKNNPIVYRDPTGHVQVTQEETRTGDVFMRYDSGIEQVAADNTKGIAKLGAKASDRIISQTESKLGHSGIVKQAFKYNDHVVGIMVTDIVGDKIVDRLITKSGSAEWDPQKERWSKFDKYETIDQYKFFRVGTIAEGEKAVNKLDKAMKDDKIRYDMDALFSAIGGKLSLITNSKNWKRELGKFKEGDNKMVCTELVAWAYDDGNNAKLGKSFLALPDQIYKNQGRYNIYGQLIPGVDEYKRKDVLDEYKRSKK